MYIQNLAPILFFKLISLIFLTLNFFKQTFFMKASDAKAFTHNLPLLLRKKNDHEVLVVCTRSRKKIL